MDSVEPRFAMIYIRITETTHTSRHSFNVFHVFYPWEFSSKSQITLNKYVIKQPSLFL